MNNELKPNLEWNYHPNEKEEVKSEKTYPRFEIGEEIWWLTIDFEKSEFVLLPVIVAEPFNFKDDEYEAAEIWVKIDKKVHLTEKQRVFKSKEEGEKALALQKEQAK